MEAIGKALRWAGENVEIDREGLRETMEEMEENGNDFWNDVDVDKRPTTDI